MAYTLKPLRSGFSFDAMAALVHQAAQDEGWLCWAFSNHDVERAASRWNPAPGGGLDTEFARLLLEFQLSLRGTACLYQGEELGLHEAELEEQHLRDPFGITYWPEFRGRDGSRTPMPWREGAPHGGFSTAQSWLPVPLAHHARAVDRSETQANSPLNACKRFVRYRRRHPALRIGTLRPLPLPAPLLGFVREHAGDKVVCLFNFSAQSVDLCGAQHLATGLPDRLAPFGTAFAAATGITAQEALLAAD